MRLKLAIVALALLAQASAVAAPKKADDPAGVWVYVPKGSSTPILVQKFDEYGDPVSLPPPADAEAKAVADKMASDPMVAATFYKDANGSYSIEQILDVETGSVDFDKDKGAQKVLKHYNAICEGNRATTGQLLYCLRRMMLRLEDDAALARKMLEKPGIKDAEKSFYQDTLKSNLILRKRTLAAALTLAQGKGLALDQLGGGTLLQDGSFSRAMAGFKKHEDSHVGSPFRKGGKKGGYNPDYLDCAWTRGVEKQAWVQPNEVACRNKGANLEMFTKEMKYFFIAVDVQTLTQEYIETLRMEAIARVVRSNYDLTGETLSASCGPFNPGIARFNEDKAKPSPSVRSPEFRAKLREGAKRIQNGVAAARKLKGFIDQCLATTPDGACIETPEQRDAEKELEQLKKELLGEIVKYPHLMANHSPKKEIYEDLPFVDKFAGASDADMDSLLAAASVGVKADLKKTVDKFCKGDNTDWEDLVRMPELTEAVLAKYPEFRAVQDCANVRYDMNHYWDGMGTALGMGACMLGSIGPQAVIVGPVCAATFLGVAIKDYVKANDDLKWTKACLATASGDETKTTICHAGDFEKAAEKYDSAVTDLYLNGAFAALEGATAIAAAVREVRAMRAVAAVHGSAELEAGANGLKGVKTLDQAEHVVQGSSPGFKTAAESLSAARAELKTAADALGANLPKGFAAGADRLGESEVRALAKRLKDIQAIEDPAVAKAALRELQEETEAAVEARGPHLATEGPKYNLDGLKPKERLAVEKTLDKLERNGVPRSKILEEFPCLK